MCIRDSDIYVACGVAAAISAGFGAPIAAVVLVSEAILRHFAVRAVAPITVSAIVATAVTPLFFDRVSPYSVTASPTDWGLIPVVLGLGACAAILAIVFMRSLLRTAAWAKSRNNDLAMLLLAATLMALIGMLVPEAVGLGTQSVNDLWAGEKLVGEAAHLARVVDHLAEVGLLAAEVLVRRAEQHKVARVLAPDDISPGTRAGTREKVAASSPRSRASVALSPPSSPSGSPSSSPSSASSSPSSVPEQASSRCEEA